MLVIWKKLVILLSALIRKQGDRREKERQISESKKEVIYLNVR